MTDFPTLLNTSTSKIPTLSHTWSLKKVPLSGRASLYRALKGIIYIVSSAEEAQKLIDDFETRNTVKFSSYKASKGFGGKGEKYLPVYYYIKVGLSTRSLVALEKWRSVLKLRGNGRRVGAQRTPRQAHSPTSISQNGICFVHWHKQTSVRF